MSKSQDGCLSSNQGSLNKVSDVKPTAPRMTQSSSSEGTCEKQLQAKIGIAHDMLRCRKGSQVYLFGHLFRGCDDDREFL